MKTKHRNYYDVLGVERDASQDEIKRAFRRLAKKYHPDANRGATVSPAPRLKELMAAYKVLGNKRERARYDALLQTRPDQGDKKEISEKKRRRQSAANLLGLLLDGQGREALEKYDRMRETGFDIEAHMSKRDYLDCMFLLGEQMERAERYEEAAGLYEDLYHRERRPPRDRYFFSELEDRLKKLYSRILPLEAEEKPDQALKYYERVLQFELNGGEKAFVFKKIAETYLRKNEPDKAEEFYEKAMELKPELKGTTQLREELEMQTRHNGNNCFPKNLENN